MAARPIDLSSYALKRTFRVQAAATITKGCGVALGTLETDIVDAGANGKAIGIALQSGTAGDMVEVALFGYAVVPVKVGTGGATHGEHAIATADGFTNQTLGGGTTVKYIEGIFLQTGVVGDLVGMLFCGRFAGGA